MARKNRGLGRGIDAIYLENALDASTQGAEAGITSINLGLIDPKADQPRKYFDREALEALSESIKENGVLQPIIVREYENARYQIIAGERRFRAAKLAGLEEIPAIILERDDLRADEISLIENIQREDLNPVEEALAFRALINNYSLTQEELSRKVGRSRSAIANTMRILDLSDDILEMVANRDITEGHARALLALTDPSLRMIFAARVVENDMSVRELEEEVKRQNKRKPVFEEEDEKLPVVDYVRELELKLESHLGREVKLKSRGKKKSITLFYQDNEDLDELIRSICGKDLLD